MSDSSESALIPVLGKDTMFLSWRRSDAKAYLRCKEVFGHCLVTSAKAEDAAAKEKCAGILWSMLGKDVKPLVQQHEDDPKAMWEALETIFSPRKAGARFNAYKTFTSIHLQEDESLLALVGCVRDAMRRLKDSRSKEFTLDKADEELQAVVLLMALPDDSRFSALKSPFEQSSSDLNAEAIMDAHSTHQGYRTHRQEGDTSQISPLSGLAMAAAPPSALVAQPAAALAAAPPVQSPSTCAGCGKPNHQLVNCFKFLELLGKKGKDRSTPEYDTLSRIANTIGLVRACAIPAPLTFPHANSTARELQVPHALESGQAL
ncbi:hypothetical protein B0H14DRAFT_3609237 [Mycena olivaceomarginata]|nr:hypothetical protein B0H14DRAFT_3609237 [Mycena olivaceomarginata]